MNILNRFRTGNRRRYLWRKDHGEETQMLIWMLALAVTSALVLAIVRCV